MRRLTLETLDRQGEEGMDANSNTITECIDTDLPSVDAPGESHSANNSVTSTVRSGNGFVCHWKVRIDTPSLFSRAVHFNSLPTVILLYLVQTPQLGPFHVQRALPHSFTLKLRR